MAGKGKDREVRMDVWFLGGPHDGRGPVNVGTTQRKIDEKTFTYEGIEYRIWKGMVPLPDSKPTKRTYLIHPRATRLYQESI
jgi:hypothetical protein